MHVRVRDYVPEPLNVAQREFGRIKLSRPIRFQGEVGLKAIRANRIDEDIRGPI